MKQLSKIKGSLSELAFDSQKSQGRNKEDKDEMEVLLFLGQDDPFLLDYHKIINCKSFRRLAGKTQVFPFPANPMIRNRLTHTMEVISISETIAIILGLNVNLVRAIAAAHDIGHTPFGHLGERVLSELSQKKFRHEKFGIILAENIERSGRGLNLSKEVLQGVLNHSRGDGEMFINKKLATEFNVVMLADKVAYTFSDINDAIRVGRINSSEKIIKKLGQNQREQVNNCIKAICIESAKKGEISFDDSREAKIFKKIRSWMYENLYLKMDGEKSREILYEKLSEVYLFLDKAISQKENDTSIMMATMTDQEVHEIFKIVKNATIKDVAKIRKMGFFELKNFCKKYDYEKIII